MGVGGIQCKDKYRDVAARGSEVANQVPVTDDVAASACTEAAVALEASQFGGSFGEGQRRKQEDCQGKQPIRSVYSPASKMTSAMASFLSSVA